MTDRDYLRSLRQPEPENPLRILCSACLRGNLCVYDGTHQGAYSHMRKLFAYNTVKVSSFCPEDFSFGTPREMSDIHGGNGFDVLDGRARVISESGVDWTEGMLRAAEQMLALARRDRIELAILLDISAACGSQVIYDGNRYSPNKKYQAGMGVCAAILHRNGFKVISQRDYASFELLFAALDSSHCIDPTALDHNETEWYRAYFGAA